jgi:hypothetical protein
MDGLGGRQKGGGGGEGDEGRFDRAGERVWDSPPFSEF